MPAAVAAIFRTGSRRPLARLAAAAVPALVVAAPRAAEACAVCFGGRESDWTGGFFLGTALMLLLPPAIIGGAALAIWRATKRQEARLRERDTAARRVPSGV